MSGKMKKLLSIALTVAMLAGLNGNLTAYAASSRPVKLTNYITDAELESLSVIQAEEEEYVETEQNGDGTETIRIYGEPIKYQDSNGQWKKIDNSIVQNKASDKGVFAYRNAGSDAKLRMADNAFGGDMMKISYDRYTIGMKPVNDDVAKEILDAELQKAAEALPEIEHPVEEPEPTAQPEEPEPTEQPAEPMPTTEPTPSVESEPSEEPAQPEEPATSEEPVASEEPADASQPVAEAEPSEEAVLPEADREADAQEFEACGQLQEKALLSVSVKEPSDQKADLKEEAKKAELAEKAEEIAVTKAQLEEAQKPNADLSDKVEALKEAGAEDSILAKKQGKSTLIYDNAFGEDTSVQISSLQSGIKDDIILDKLPEQREFSYDFTVENVVPRIREDGNVYFIDESRNLLVASIPIPFMYDSSSEERFSYDIQVSLYKLSSNTYRYTMKPDRTWLEDRSRVYPVVIDPAVTFKKGTGLMDTYITEKYSGNNYGTATEIKVGNGNDLLTSRGLVRLDQDILTSKVTKATLQSAKYYTVQNYNGSSSPTYNLQMIHAGSSADGWGETTVTWKSFQEKLKDGRLWFGAVVDSQTIGATVNKKYTWNITNAVSEWLSGTRNRGLCLKLANDSTSATKYYKRFLSADSKTNTSYIEIETKTIGAPATPNVSTNCSNSWTNGSVTVSWSGLSAGTNSSGLSDVQYSTTSATTGFKSTNKVTATGSVSLSLPETPPSGGTVWVRGVNKEGKTGAAGAAKYHRDVTPPVLGGEMTATPQFTSSVGNIVLQWPAATDAASGVSQYQLAMRANGGEWSYRNVGKVTSYTYTGLADQTIYQFAMRAFDVAGNGCGFTYSRNIDAGDHTPPATPNVSISPAGWTNNTHPTLSWSGLVDANLHQVQYLLNGVWTQASMSAVGSSGSVTLDCSALPDGAYRIYVRGVDAAGNYGVSGSTIYYKDTTSPTAPASVTISPAGPTNNLHPTLSWSGIEEANGLSAVMYKLNGVWLSVPADKVAPSGSLVLDCTNVPDGKHTIYVQGIDVAGNAHNVTGAVYDKDTTPPTVPTNVTVSPEFSKGPVTVSFTAATDAQSGIAKYQYATSVSNTAEPAASVFADMPANGQITPDEGTGYVWVRAVDNADNEGPAVYSNKYTVDKTDPIAQLAPAEKGTTIIGPKTKFKMQATDANLERWEITCGSVVMAQGTTSITRDDFDLVNFDDVPEGIQTLTLTVRDKSGNEEEAFLKNVTIDKSAPNAPDARVAFERKEDEEQNDEDHPIRVITVDTAIKWAAVADNPQENASGIKEYTVWMKEKDAAEYRKEKTLPVESGKKEYACPLPNLEAGKTYMAYVEVTDEVENSAKSQPREFMKLETPPVTFSITPSGWTTSEKQPVVSWEWTGEQNPEMDKLQYSLDNGVTWVDTEVEDGAPANERTIRHSFPNETAEYKIKLRLVTEDGIWLDDAVTYRRYAGTTANPVNENLLRHIVNDDNTKTYPYLLSPIGDCGTKEPTDYEKALDGDPGTCWITEEDCEGAHFLVLWFNDMYTINHVEIQEALDESLKGYTGKYSIACGVQQNNQKRMAHKDVESLINEDLYLENLVKLTGPKSAQDGKVSFTFDPVVTNRLVIFVESPNQDSTAEQAIKQVAVSEIVVENHQENTTTETP